MKNSVEIDVDEIEQLLQELEGGPAARQRRPVTALKNLSPATNSEQRHRLSHQAVDFSTYANSTTTSNVGMRLFDDAEDYHGTAPRIRGRLEPLTQSPQQHSEDHKQQQRWSQYSTILGGGAAPAVGGGGLMALPSQDQGQQPPPATQQDIEDDDGVGTVNFMPVMHARYLSDVGGITPRARWGHTLTTLGEDQILLFGGTVMPHGDASADLFAYQPKSNSWEPLSISSGQQGDSVTAAAASSRPAARYLHAAVVVEQRYLVIYGGKTSHGTTAVGDMWAYDTLRHEWTLWYPSSSSSSSSNASTSPLGGEDVKSSSSSTTPPATIFGHSIIVWKQRLYIFGGRVTRNKSATSAGAAELTKEAPSNDVYVFHWPSKQWKKRCTASSSSASASATNATEEDGGEEVPSCGDVPTAPSKRAFHAACCHRSGFMIVQGGEGGGSKHSEQLTDTWAFDLTLRTWSLLHGGWNGDCAARSRHTLMTAGEAILAIGGCARRAATNSALAPSALVQRVDSFLSVLPVTTIIGTQQQQKQQLVSTGVWSSVALGNANNNSVVAPTLKYHGAALLNGFVYMLGGMPSDTEPPSNHLIRCLATDGVPRTLETLSIQLRRLVLTSNSSAGNSQQQQQEQRQQRSALDDLDGAFGYRWDADLCLQVGEKQKLYVHRAIVMQRAPIFFQDLLTCRHEVGVDYGSQPSTVDTFGRGEDLLHHRVACSPPCVMTAGNSRVKGLTVPLTEGPLRALLFWIYTGSINPEVVAAYGPVLQQAACQYALPQLADALAAQSASAPHSSSSSRQLAFDMHQLFTDCTTQGGYSSSTCNTTILFVDPHTGQEAAHPAHTWVLANACSAFAHLLRPLFTSVDGTHTQDSNVSEGITAKIGSGKRVQQLTTTGGGGGGAASTARRGLVIGPVRIPLLSVKPILRYLYTTECSVDRESALQVLIGASTLHLTVLQRHCEALIAREEVNFSSCCDYITLARNYRAQLLEEMSLVTAAVGFHGGSDGDVGDEVVAVKRSASFLNLDADDQRQIARIADEVRGLWHAPSPVKTEQKAPEVYAARFAATQGK